MSTTPRKKRNDSKVNLTISIVFHTLLIGAIFFLAAREGMLGKKLKEITVTLAPKEKKPEPPKEKPAEPKPEEPKLADKPKPADIPQPKAAPTVATPPPTVVEAAPAVAPAVASLPSFEFNDGAHQVESISDPTAIYKALVEHSFRTRWNRPEDLEDTKFVAEVELTIDKTGNIESYQWVRGSGNKRWDESVKASLAAVKAINRPPPKGFPDKFITRFDVETLEPETASIQ
jgi:protein TonB